MSILRITAVIRVFPFRYAACTRGKENSNPPTNKQRKRKSSKVTVTEKKKLATGRKKNNSSPKISSNKQRKRKPGKVKVKDKKKRAIGTIIIASDPPQMKSSRAPQSQLAFSQGNSSGSEPVLKTPSRRQGGVHGDKRPKESLFQSNQVVDMDIIKTTTTSTSSSEDTSLSESSKYCTCLTIVDV